MTDHDPTDMPSSRPARMIGFAVLGAFGAYGVFVAINLGLWRGRSPGEGLFPFMTAASMVAFSAAGFVSAFAMPRIATEDGGTSRESLWRMGAYVVALLFYALALEPLGFVAATILSVAAILRFAERYSWLVTLAIAVGAAAACHVLFGVWLGAQLPTGTLWERFR